MSVSFFLFPCSKRHLVRYYLNDLTYRINLILLSLVVIYSNLVIILFADFKTGSSYSLHLLFSFLQFVKLFLLARRFNHNTKQFFFVKSSRSFQIEFNVDISLINKNVLYEAKTPNSNGIFQKERF